MIEIDDNMNEHDIDDLLEELLKEEIDAGLWLSLDLGDKLELSKQAQGCVKEDPKNKKKKTIDSECIKGLARRFSEEVRVKIERKQKEIEQQQKLFADAEEPLFKNKEPEKVETSIFKR